MSEKIVTLNEEVIKGEIGTVKSYAQIQQRHL